MGLASCKIDARRTANESLVDKKKERDFIQNDNNKNQQNILESFPPSQRWKRNQGKPPPPPCSWGTWHIRQESRTCPSSKRGGCSLVGILKQENVLWLPQCGAAQEDGSWIFTCGGHESTLSLTLFPMILMITISLPPRGDFFFICFIIHICGLCKPPVYKLEKQIYTLLHNSWG